MSKTELSIASIALIFSLLALMFYLQPTIDYTQVLNLEMNEGNGNIAYDSSKYKNNGTIYGATWIDEKNGKALSFDGNDYVQINDAYSIKTFTQLSLLCWINISNVVPAGSAFTIISKRYWENYLLFVSDGQNIKATLTADAQVDCTGTSAIIPNHTYFICLTYDGINMRLYVNIILEKTQPLTGIVASSTDDLFIGKLGTPWNTWFFKGVIDDVRIYNRALSIFEMQDIYLGEL